MYPPGVPGSGTHRSSCGASDRDAPAACRARARPGHPAREPAGTFSKKWMRAPHRVQGLNTLHGSPRSVERHACSDCWAGECTLLPILPKELLRQSWPGPPWILGRGKEDRARADRRKNYYSIGGPLRCPGPPSSERALPSERKLSRRLAWDDARSSGRAASAPRPAAPALASSAPRRSPAPRDQRPAQAAPAARFNWMAFSKSS